MLAEFCTVHPLRSPMSAESSSVPAQEALQSDLQRIFSTNGPSSWFTAAVIALAYALYVGLRQLLSQSGGVEDSLALASSIVQAFCAAALMLYVVHAYYRWQEYPRILRGMAELSAKVSEPLRDWFSSQVYFLTNSESSDGWTSEGTRSVWEPYPSLLALFLAICAFLAFVSISSFLLATDYSAWQALSLLSLGLALALSSAALFPRMYVSPNSPSAAFLKESYKIATRFGDDKESIFVKHPLSIRVPFRLRAQPFWLVISIAVTLFGSTVFTAHLRRSDQEHFVDAAFVRALTGPAKSVSAQIAAAHLVTMQPRIWGATGVGVYPDKRDAPARFSDDCSDIVVGSKDNGPTFAVCGAGFSHLQLDAISLWAQSITPAQAMSLENVPKAEQGLIWPEHSN